MFFLTQQNHLLQNSEKYQQLVQNQPNSFQSQHFLFLEVPIDTWNPRNPSNLTMSINSKQKCFCDATIQLQPI